MFWSDDEILCFYHEAKNKKQSIQIMADCNGTIKREIRKVLISRGILPPGDSSAAQESGEVPKRQREHKRKDLKTVHRVSYLWANENTGERISSFELAKRESFKLATIETYAARRKPVTFRASGRTWYRVDLPERMLIDTANI